MQRKADTEYPTTEAGLADRIRDELRGKIAFNAKEQSWYWYGGKVWARDDTSRAGRMVLEDVVRTIPEEDWNWQMNTIADEKQRVHLAETLRMKQLRFTESCENDRRISSALRMARPVMSAEFDTADLLAFDNGVLLPSGEFRRHDPADHITTLIPTPYTSEVDHFAPGAEFLRQISCNDTDWIHSVLSILGYCLMRGNPEQAFFVFKGSGANGKGVLLSWLKLAFGSAVGVVSGKELQKKNKDQRQTTLVDTIERCRVIIADEVGEEALDDNLIKSLTGDRSVQLKRINTGMQECQVIGTLIMVTNSLPEFGSGGKSMMRREVAVPFDMDLPVAQQNPNLLDRLATPEGNIWLVSLVVREMQRYLSRSGGGFRESLCSRIQEFSREAFHEQDEIQRFILENLIHEDGARTPGADVFRVWYDWKYGEMQELADLRDKYGAAQFICRNPNEAKNLYDGLKAHGIHIATQGRYGGGTARNLLMDWRLRTDRDGVIEAGQARII